MKFKLWCMGGVGMLAIWVLSWGIREVAQSRKATAGSIIARLESRPLSEVPPGRRRAYLEDLAGTVNRLNFEERRQLSLRRALDATFEAMTEAERRAFLDQTLPQGFDQILQVFNKMSPQERKVAVGRALEDLKRADDLARGADWSRTQARLDDGTLQHIVDEGFQSYLKTASAETKLDLAPVIEQIQQNVRSFHRP